MAVAGLAGCGTPGAPLPPSLRLPKPVDDLRAARKGDAVRLTWTAPERTTDEEGIREDGETRICRGRRADGTCGSELPSRPFHAAQEAGKRQTAEDDLTALLHAPQRPELLTYTLEITNGGGRSAGPSPAATVFLAPSLSPPQRITATVEPDAVVLRWEPAAIPGQGAQAAAFRYRVLRAAAGGAPQMVAELPAGQPGVYRDDRFVWEQHYSYRVVGVTQVLSREGKLLGEFEGADPAPIEVFAHDVFAPAAPRDAQAVYAGALDANQNFIDVTWSPSPEADLAGYNVYRSTDGRPAERISKAPVATPSFRDAQVAAGHDYAYTISAIDARGNESARSAPAAEKIPPP